MVKRSVFAALAAVLVSASLCFAAYAQEPPPITPPPEETQPAAGHVYFYLEDQLTAVEREITGGGQMIEFAVIELLNGPSEEEKAAGYVTYIPEGVKLQYTTIKQDRSEFSVNLSRELLELAGDREAAVKALTQVVRTIQDISGIAVIGITVAGEGMGDQPQDAFEALGVSRSETGSEGQGPQQAEEGSGGKIALFLVIGILGAAALTLTAFFLLRKRKPAAARSAKKKGGGKRAPGKKAGK